MIPPIDVVRLPADIGSRLRQEANRRYPREACGFLVGRQSGGEASVLRMIVAENRARRDDRFLIDAGDVFGAMQSARRQGVELLGIYHSHPDAGPEPSPTDRADAWGEWLYLIVSTTGTANPSMRSMHGQSGRVADGSLLSPEGDMSCWRWDGERFVAVGLLRSVERGVENRVDTGVDSGAATS